MPKVWAGLEEAEAAELARLAAGKRVLEIGSAFGYSTIIMGKVAKHVIAVDPHTGFDSWPQFRLNLYSHGVAGKVSPWGETSQTALPELNRGGQRFELIFIDGDHLPDSVRHDLAWARRLVTPGGTIALHDYLLAAGTFVKLACDEWRPVDRLVETLGIYEDVQPLAGEHGLPGG